MSWSSALVPAFVVACLVVACGGKIEQTSDGSTSGGAGSSGKNGSTGANTNGSTTGTTPSQTMPGTTSTSSSGSSSGSTGTYINGPVGFVVQDAFSFDAGPETSREARGVWITSFANACNKKSATTGALVLRIDFSDESGTVPAGTYPLEGISLPSDHATAYAQVWAVTPEGCSAMGNPGPRFESGEVVIEKSTPSVLIGSFKGVMVDDDGNPAPIDGHFDAPRCPSGSDACTPPL